MLPDEKPSKTQRKKAMHALQDLGEQLVALGREQIAQVPLSVELRDAVLEAKRISAHEGRRRQLQYVGRLMREATPAQVEAIRTKLEGWHGQSREEAMLHRSAERWRERLLEDDDALNEFAAQHAGNDLQPLRALLRATRKEQLEGNGPRHYRELYRLIRGIVAGEGRAEPEEENDDE